LSFSLLVVFPRSCIRAEAGHDPLDVARADGDVGVVDEQKIVAGVRCQLNERTDLAVGSQAQRALDEMDGAIRELGLQLGDGRYGRVGSVETPKSSS